MALTQWRFLNTARLNRVIGTLADTLIIERPLVYLNRLTLVPSFDDEMIGRFTGKLIAADVIADDQKAVVQEGLSLEVFAHSIPNIKLGQNLTQKFLTRLQQFEQGSLPGGENALRDWDSKIAENLLMSVRQRLNSMACAMMLDTWSYDRFGVKVSGASWGMPANLKVTTATAWSNVASTPIADILGLDEVARINYGIIYDTLTMGSTDFNNMVKTTEFANRVSLTLNAGFSVGVANLMREDQAAMLTLAGKLLNKTIVIDDHTYYTRNNAGTVSAATRTLPANKVLLSRKQDEGNPNVMDMANGIVQESNQIEELPENSYGPVAYYTPSAEDANPPGWNVWAVSRSFPRKFVPEATAVLTTTP